MRNHVEQLQMDEVDNDDVDLCNDAMKLDKTVDTKLARMKA